MTANTTQPMYWLNWRFLICAIWVLSSVIVASILIWRYEGPKRRHRRGALEATGPAPGLIYADDSWKPCLKDIHPAWLLIFRLAAFFIMAVLLVVNALVDGGRIFYYYTQWTFILVTIYFGLGSLLSIYGCHHYLSKVGRENFDRERLDTERGTAFSRTNSGKGSTAGMVKSSGYNQDQDSREVAGLCGYLFQILYQTNAGAVMVTDFVFWLIIFPFLAIKDYDLNFLLIGMHSVNAVFLLGDTALNSLHFAWFRIGYFLLWTSIYVVFQWILHACVSVWWPYPFLDISSPYAPLWYLIVAMLHVPCYAFFMLIIKLKHTLLSKRFPQSYQGMRKPFIT